MAGEPYRPGCTGKVRYVSRSAAKAGARSHRANRGSRKLHIYACSWCGNWHLTSSPVPREWCRQRDAAIQEREGR